MLTYNEDIQEAISTSISISICLLILVNVSYVITVIVQGYREKKRNKLLREEHEISQKKRKEELDKAKETLANRASPLPVNI